MGHLCFVLYHYHLLESLFYLLTAFHDFNHCRAEFCSVSFHHCQFLETDLRTVFYFLCRSWETKRNWKKSYKQMTTALKKVALERCVWEQKEGEGGSNSLSLELKRMAFDAS